VKTYSFHDNGTYSLIDEDGYSHSGTWEAERGEIWLKTNLNTDEYIKYIVCDDGLSVYLRGFRYYKQ